MKKLPYLYVIAGCDWTKGLVYNNLATARVKLLFFLGGGDGNTLPSCLQKAGETVDDKL